MWRIDAKDLWVPLSLEMGDPPLRPHFLLLTLLPLFGHLLLCPSTVAPSEGPVKPSYPHGGKGAGDPASRKVEEREVLIVTLGFWGLQ